LEKIIRHDQALTAKLLAIANSPYYGFRHEITSVSRAVVAIGYNEVRNLCMGLSLMNYMHPETFKDRLEAEMMWLHSLLVSEAARIVAEKTGKMDAEMAFTAGLLHDVGKVILAAFFPDEMLVLKRLIKERNYFLLEAEEALGMSHQDVGRHVSQDWKLPAMFTEVLGRHHNPRPYHSFFNMIAAVHIADNLARMTGLGGSDRPDALGIHTQALDGLRLSMSDIDECFDNLLDRKDAVVNLWKNMVDPENVSK
jgi:putative nucleotidyltransferase with HDIG domain